MTRLVRRLRLTVVFFRCLYVINGSMVARAFMAI
jgi:hypothetical protein